MGCTSPCVHVDGKGMLAVTLCCIKILQLLTEGAGKHELTCTMAVKRLLLLLCYVRIDINSRRMPTMSLYY